MTSTIKQVVIIIIVAAVLGGGLNLIRYDQVPWISAQVVLPVGDPSQPDSSSNSSQPFTPKSILLDAVEKLIGKGAIIIDARSEELYEDGHIPTAINIPFENLGPYYTKMTAIPKDALIIIYCDGGDCELSYDLAVYMLQKEYRHLYVYQGGWAEWETSGKPIAKGREP
jgi:rhodanese-related sulfurtransferase